MLKRGTIFLCSILLMGLLTAPMAIGAGEYEIFLVKSFTSMTPVYMSGHPGDPNWIEGFDGAGDINVDGSKVGTFTATIKLFNPPMSLTERYDSGLIKMVNTIPTYGTFETNGLFLSMGSSTSSTSGDTTFAWFGSVSNGTGSLSNMVGLAGGTAQGNIFTGTGTGTENLLFRMGY